MTTQPLTVGTITIRQSGGLYSLKDLHHASGGDSKHQPSNFVRLETTQSLIAEISNSSDMRNYSPIETVRGKFGGTYACRELVIAYAAWISAAFHLKVIRVFLDSVAPAQQPLPLPSPALDAAQVNDIVTHTAEGILERLEKRCLLIHWRQVISALKHESTDIGFPELTDLTQACLKRLQRNIGAEAYSAIAQRAANRKQTTATVSLAA